MRDISRGNPNGRYLARILALLLCVGLASTALAACGSSDSGSPAAEATTGEEASGGSEGADIAALQAEIAALEKRPTSIGITEPLENPAPEGKTATFMRCPVPICVELGEQFKEASEAVGWKTNFVNIGGTPSEIKAAYDKAVADEPDAIVGTGISRELIEPEIAKMKEKGIPYVVEATPDEAGDGITASVYGGSEYVSLGEAVADYVIADSEGSANALFVSTPQYLTTVKESEGFVDRISQTCPECQASKLEVPAETIGSTLPSQIVSYLQSHTDIDYVVFAFSDMGLGVPDAVSSAGLAGNVSMVAQGISPATIPMVAQDQLKATLATPSPELMWRMVDVLMRTFNEESLDPSVDSPYPEMWVNSGNLPAKKTFPLVPDYQEQYLELWGLNG